MRCSKCGSDSPAGKKFCEDCGAPFATPCPTCGAETTTGKRFCGECGAPLQTASTNAEPREGSLTAERRHLTVLFCDLVGSTEIAAQLDPEEWRDLVGAYHRAAAEAITRYGGHVAKYLGDGVMAYFGWPEAHENDAERAARAGLAVLGQVSKLNQDSACPKIAVRVAIDSGAVVVGAGEGKDTDVFGETANIAARLQATGEPGVVLITSNTHRLLSGLFIVDALGPRALKGIATPLEVFRVCAPDGSPGTASGSSWTDSVCWA
jgi:class 3 adenylate cyclase